MQTGSDAPIADRVVLRTATKQDIDALLAFWNVAAEDADRPTDRRDAVETLIARDPDALLIALINDRIVGCVIAGWDGWRAHLYRLAVHPDHRRQGLARQLLEVAEQRLIDLGAIRLDAMVLNDNQLGQRLWSASGYAPQTSWSRWVKPVG